MYWRKKLYLIISGLIVAYFSFSCEQWMGNRKIESAGEKEDAVCIKDSLPVRDKPGGDAKQISSLHLGESVSLGEKKKGSADPKDRYLKIRLSDGMTGWVLDEGLIKEAITGVIKSNTRIFERPEQLTILESKYGFLDMVAIIHIKGEWVEVVGRNRSRRGWIKSSFVSTNKDDVAAAILVKKQLAKNIHMSRKEKIERAIIDSPYPNSYIIEILRKLAVLYAVEEHAIGTDGDQNNPNLEEDLW